MFIEFILENKLLGEESSPQININSGFKIRFTFINSPDRIFFLRNSPALNFFEKTAIFLLMNDFKKTLLIAIDFYIGKLKNL